jgi:hypothetical protein
MNVRARAVLVALAAVTLTSAATAGPNRAEQQVSAVSEWNAIAQAETVLLRPTAHGQMRGMAMVQGAVYDAVNAIDRSRKPYLLDPAKVRVGRTASVDAAAATAAYRVLLAITPEPRHAGLDTRTRPRLGGCRTGRADRAGSVPVRQPRRRCWPLGRTTDSWRPSRL